MACRECVDRSFGSTRRVLAVARPTRGRGSCLERALPGPAHTRRRDHRDPDNFVRAETDLYFGNIVKDGGFGTFHHIRELSPLDRQLVIRQNRDTLYSSAVFDLDAGPVSISMPDPGRRFMSLQLITEDHYVPAVFYGKGEHTITKEQTGTRYVAAAVRTLVDPGDPADLVQVHALQDGVSVRQEKPGAFDVPKWDGASQRKVRDGLLQLAATLTDTTAMFGTKATTDPVRHLIGTASAWGEDPEKDASTSP